jgi:hypothetical protein
MNNVTFGDVVELRGIDGLHIRITHLFSNGYSPDEQLEPT